MSIISKITRRIVSMAHPSYRYGTASFSQEGEDLSIDVEGLESFHYGGFSEARSPRTMTFRFTNRISGEKKI